MTARLRSSRRLRPLVVGALAIAHHHANAVGPVRLACEGDTLRIELLRVSRFAQGFAFVGSAGAVSFRVPYTAVRGLVRSGRTLHLSLDPAVAAPYNRFALARFSRDAHQLLLRAFRLRALAVAASWLLPPAVAALAAWRLPARWVTGQLGVAAAALVAGWLSWHLLRRLVAWLSWGGPDSDRLRAAFEHTVAARLGLEPAAELAEDPAVLLAPPPVLEARPTVGQALATALRPLLFGTVALVGVAAVVGAVLLVERYGIASAVFLPVDPVAEGLGPAAGERAAAVVRYGSPQRRPCRCGRVDSPMWRGGLPQLSIVLSPILGHVGALWLEPGRTYPIHFGGVRAPVGSEPGRGRPRKARKVRFDLAVVNNGDAPLDEIDLVVTFARRDAQGERRGLIERGLHWPALLGPGGSVKWRVSARGTELKIDTRHDARLGAAGIGPAAADAFHALRTARLGEVRVHAAMMLAYLADERAAGLAKQLAGLPSLSPWARRALDELGAASAPLQLCDVVVERDAVRGCLFNGDDRPHLAMTVREVGGVGRRSWTVADRFGAGRGLGVRLPTRGKQPYAFAVEAAPLPRR